MRTIPVRLLASLPLLLVAACGSDRLELDQARLDATILQRTDPAVASPVVASALDGLFDRLAAQPGVHAKGEKLMADLGDEPALQPAFAKLLEQVGQLPGMAAMVAQVIKEHPTAKPDEIGELVSARIGKVTDGPAFNHAFDRAFATLIKRPDLKAAFDRLGRLVIDAPAVKRAMPDALRTVTSDAMMARRVRAWNGGKKADRTRATDSMLERVFTVERMAQLYADIFTMPALAQHLGAASGEILAAPSFRRHTVKAIAAFIDTPAFQAGAMKVMGLLIGEPTEAALEAALGDLFKGPAVGDALARLIADLEGDPALQAIAGPAIEKVSSDPALAATFAKFLSPP